MSNIKQLFNIIGFQFCWWVCVLGVKFQYPLLGPFLMAIFILIHILYISQNNNENIFIVLVSILGAFIDTAFLNTSLIIYNGLTINYFAPFWIIAMWAGFSTTINHSLAWLKNRYLYSFFLGAISGPLSYIAGFKFDAVIFEYNVFTVLILSISWGLLVPLVFYINDIVLDLK